MTSAQACLRVSSYHLVRSRSSVLVAWFEHTLLSWEQCFASIGVQMELRHLRYFVAVADAGNLTVAAQRMLHTSQPSLSRQIRDLEDEVGTPLLTRRARGLDLTPAGRAFLDHARSVLSQVEAASEAARRVAGPAKPCFAMGFLTGHELTWMPEALRILRDELPNIEVMISSQYSPLLAEGLSKGRIDAAFFEGTSAARPRVHAFLELIDTNAHRFAARRNFPSQGVRCSALLVPSRMPFLATAGQRSCSRVLTNLLSLRRRSSS